MSRTWKMQKVTGHLEEPAKYWPGAMRLYFAMECGHYRHYGYEKPDGTHLITYSIDGYDPGMHAVGDKARCYECKRTEGV